MFIAIVLNLLFSLGEHSLPNIIVNLSNSIYLKYGELTPKKYMGNVVIDKEYLRIEFEEICLKNIWVLIVFCYWFWNKNLYHCVED